MEKIKKSMKELREIVKNEMLLRMNTWQEADKRHTDSNTKKDIEESIAILDRFKVEDVVIKRQKLSRDIKAEIVNKLKENETETETEIAKETTETKEQKMLKRMLRKIYVLKSFDKADEVARKKFHDLLNIINRRNN